MLYFNISNIKKKWQWIGKIKIIGNENFYESRILIDTVDKFSHDIALENFVILMTRVIQDWYLLWTTFFRIDILWAINTKHLKMIRAIT